LKGPHHQLTLLQKIKPCPVQIRQGVVDERRRIRRIGYEVALTAEKPAEFVGKARVVARLVVKIVALSRETHGVPRTLLREGTAVSKRAALAAPVPGIPLRKGILPEPARGRLPLSLGLGPIQRPDALV